MTRISQMAAGIAIFAGLLDLVAWKFSIVAIITAGSARSGMAKNTAAAIILAGVSLLLLQERNSSKPWIKRLGAAGALTTLAIGLSTLLRLTLFHPPVSDGNLLNSSNNALLSVRMSPNTALCFILLGTALLLNYVGGNRLRLGQWCALISAMIALIACIGYAYDVRGLYGIAGYKDMAFLTAVTLLILSTGVLFSRPGVGLMAILSREGPVGTLLRRLFPTAIAVPILAGWLTTKAQNAGWYRNETGLVLYATLNVVVLLLFLSLAVISRAAAEEKFRGLLESAPDAAIIANERGRMVLVNAQTEKLFGYSRNELLGNPVEMLIPARLRERHSEHRDHYSATPHTRAMGQDLELSGLRKDGLEIPIEVSLAPIRTDEGMLVSTTIRDVTHRKRAAQEREQLIRELQEALAKVKVLSGLLPICASCKKIRDERGKWNAVEQYIRERSMVDFTHSVCPECTRQLYPEVYAKRKQT